MINRFFFIVVLSLVCLVPGISQELTKEARLLRFPAIYDNQIVFSYGGDLYTVERNGGLSRKLTSHIGYEMFAHFSPDGRYLAFTGQYDGNTEVYLMPSEGGVPQRLTYTATLDRDDVGERMGPNNIVMAWTNDGENIVYRSRKQSYNAFVGQLYSVSYLGGLSSELELPSGGFCSYSPDGKKMAYNKVFREFRTWKYYKGGMADDVWIHDSETKETVNITNNDAQDIIPMWYKNEIFFLSDRDRTMNLFVYNTETKLTEKVTAFEKYDIKFPSLGNNAIVFENEGYIYVYDLLSRRLNKVTIKIADDKVNSRDEIKDASNTINAYNVSPDGKRMVIGARGDVFSVPAIHGITRNLTASSGSHDRNPVWSPDGKYIAYVSDENGEYEIYIIDQDGTKSAIKITDKGDTYIYRIKWSPDSKKILWNDKLLRLQYVDVKSKNVTLVAKSEVWEYSQFNWSPDSKWITYASHEKNGMEKVYIYDTHLNKSFEITEGRYSSSQPVFSSDGKYLAFVSKRDFNPIYSESEWSTAYKDMSRIYMITLAKNTPSPFAPQNDEVSIDNGLNNNKSESNNEKVIEKSSNIIVDIDGIKGRVFRLPVKPSNYGGLYVIKDKVYYTERTFNSKTSNIKLYDLNKRKEIEVGTSFQYIVSSDNKKMLVRKSGSFYIVDVPQGKLTIDKALKTDLSNMKILVDTKKEWEQIFNESWRQMRDFFYDPNMHGVDWASIRKKYDVLLPYVNHRNDLNYIIGEMIGELNVGHAYVNGGDVKKPQKIYTGLLGAKLSYHPSGYYRIDKILKGENWKEKTRSPLTEIGIDVNEGDFIIAVNGRTARGMNDIFKTLVNTADKQIELTVNSKPEEAGSKKYIVVPIKDESKLYYYSWVESNIKKVNEATNGQVGYIHVPNMVTEGLNEFMKHYYPQLSKKALIIDDRGNGGGNVSPMLIEQLRREVTRSKMARNVSHVSYVPSRMMHGPKVLLVNNYSASDGDLFPYSFKKHGLGKVIGVRTWGGVVGIRGSLPFIDGGNLKKPEFASFSSEKSEWIIEGYGVDPDIEIENDPYKEYNGVDKQLNKAIEVILQELGASNEMPVLPDFPDKSK